MAFEIEDEIVIKKKIHLFPLALLIIFSPVDDFMPEFVFPLICLPFPNLQIRTPKQSRFTYFQE